MAAAPTTNVEVDTTPAPVSNWNHSVSSQPAVVVRAKSASDVCAAVKDASRFPSPLLAVGSRHTVTGAISNSGGTVVDVSAMDAILGFGEVAGQEVVRVQCGVKLMALHKWLDAQVRDNDKTARWGAPLPRRNKKNEKRAEKKGKNTQSTPNAAQKSSQILSHPSVQLSHFQPHPKPPQQKQ
jgi:hypothetical protein